MAYIGNPPLDVRSFGSTKFEFTATAGQTAFTGTDDNNIPLAFVEDQIEVYVNGVLMDNSDFSSSGGNTVTLGAAAAVNDIVTVIAAKTNVPNVDYVAATGGTFTGNVNFGDNDRVRLGDGNDLELYHDSSNNHSFIRESGTGDLRILGDNISLRSTSTDEPYINITTNGAVTLYYDNAVKLATTSAGVSVTGDLDVTTATNARLTINDAIGEVGSGNLAFQSQNSAGTALKPMGFRAEEFIFATGNVGINTSPQSFAKLQVKTDTNKHISIFNNAAGATIGGITDAGASAALRLAGSPLLMTGGGGSGAEHMRIDSNGNVGVGVSPTTAYGNVLQVHDTGTAGASLRLTDSNSGSGTGNGSEVLQLNTAMYIMNRENGLMSFSTNDTERMNISSGGQVRINTPGIGTGTSGAGLAVKALSSDSSPFTAKSASYNTVFSVLPWSGGRTYLSSGCFYEDGTWKAATHAAGMALLGLSGDSGIKFWSGDGSADDRYSNYASSLPLVTRYGVLNTRDKSFFTGNHHTQTSSTNWVTIGVSASGYTGSRVSGNLNIMRFTKLDNNSDLQINFNMPYYFQGGNNDSGFGVRLRYLAGTSGSYGTDVYASGPAHGWGAGGYGGDNQAGIVNYTWSTEKIISNTYVGEVRFYFETRVWNSNNTINYNYTSTYPKFGYIHVKEVPRD